MKRHWIVAVCSIALAGWFLTPLIVRKIKEFATGVHHKGITQELALWEKEYGQVRDHREADRAIDILEYTQRYYVPGPGNHSDPHTEAAMEEQRARTIAAIVTALEAFTGERFGTDAARWQSWKKQRQRKEKESK